MLNEGSFTLQLHSNWFFQDHKKIMILKNNCSVGNMANPAMEALFNTTSATDDIKISQLKHFNEQ